MAIDGRNRSVRVKGEKLVGKQISADEYAVEMLAKENARLKVDIAKKEFACLVLMEQKKALETGLKELKEKLEAQKVTDCREAKSEE